MLAAKAASAILHRLRRPREGNLASPTGEGGRLRWVGVPRREFTSVGVPVVGVLRNALARFGGSRDRGKYWDTLAVECPFRHGKP